MKETLISLEQKEKSKYGLRTRCNNLLEDIDEIDKGEERTFWSLFKDNWFLNDLVDQMPEQLTDAYRRSWDSIQRSRKYVTDTANGLGEKSQYLKTELSKEVSGIFRNNSPWLYYLVYIMPLLWTFGLMIGGYGLLIIPLLIFGLIPILELISCDEKVNPNDKNYNILQEDRRYMWVLWLWPIAQFYLIFAGSYSLVYWNFTFWEKVLLGISTGFINGGVGITIAHELIHRNNNMEKTLGQIILTSVMYPHFYIEHIMGHHKNIGTVMDAGTSRRNETLYEYWPRAIKMAYQNSWDLADKHKRSHIMYLYHLFVFLFLWFVFSISGIIGVVFAISQSIIAILLLETINYIEHYGLVRQSGQRVDIMHSWNTDKKSTNYLSFRLQRHSDHHQDSKRKYPNLRTFEEAPRLPTGYIGCILLAMIPPLWFKIMNKKLDLLYK